MAMPFSMAGCMSAMAVTGPMPSAPCARAIAAMAVPETGLGAAINDRLRRAAAQRD